MIFQRYRENIIGSHLTSAQPTWASLPSPVDSEVTLRWDSTNHGDSDQYHTITDFASDPDPQESNTPSNTSQPVQTSNQAYGYLRQSQTDEDESSSIESQKKAGNRAANPYDIEDIKWFVDINESGFSFEREGFEKLNEALEREPRPLILDRIDRLGRDTLETIFIAAKLHYDYEIPIITYENGLYDLDNIDDQLDLVLNAIIAGKSVKNRIVAAWKAINVRFSDRRNWGSWFNNVPIGYQLAGDENDDARWIEPTEHSSEVITAISNDLLETRQQSKTVDRIKRAADNQSISNTDSDDEATLASLDADQLKSAFEGSDYALEELDSQQLKHLLTNPVLIGEVRFPRSEDKENQNVIEDSSLQIIEENLFGDVNRFFEESRQKYSTDADKNVDMEKLGDLGLLLLSIDSIDVIRPVCPECNRGMVKNGEDHEYPLEDDRVAHYWICPKYDEEHNEADLQRKVPRNKEWKALQQQFEDEFTDISDIVLLKICPPIN